jgi:hypothetical protein
MKKTFLSFLFVSYILSSQAQLAKLTSTGEQQYRLNVDRGGVAFVTPFSKAIRSTNLGDIVPDKTGGYVKYFALKGEHGSTKQGTYVHFMRLDGKLNIKSESDVMLVAEGSENMQPISSFERDGFLSLITAGAATGQSSLSLTYWQFDLITLELTKKNVSLANFPFSSDRQYDFRSFDVSNGKGMVMTILEEGGKKDYSILHSLSFDGNLALVSKRSTTLPFTGQKGSLLQTLVNSNGTVFCMLGYPDEKNEDIAVNSLLVSSKEKSQVLSLTHGDDFLINCAIGLSTNGNALLSGLIWPGKKEYTTGLAINTVSDAGKLQVVQEEAFSPELLDKLEDADKKKGLKNDYYVRSVSERENGIMDVVINNCSLSDRWQGDAFSSRRTYSSSTTIKDAVILSFAKGKLASTIPIRRNMEHTMTYGAHLVPAQRFSVPKVFTKGGDLYLMYFDNPSNTIGDPEAKKPKWCDFTKGSLVLAKIDKNFRPTQQELIQFEKGGDFRSFYELRVNDIDNSNYILTTDKYAIFTKNVKTASILVEVK